MIDFTFILLPSGDSSRVRARVKINSQILDVEAPGCQGEKVQEYQAYSELSQRSQTGWIDG